jgi:hypothetical protein
MYLSFASVVPKLFELDHQGLSPVAAGLQLD